MILGVVKFYISRLITYASAVQFAMVIYLFLKTSGISPLYLIPVIPLSLVLIWFDRKYVLPGELAEFFKRNPEWTNRNGK